MKEKYCQETSAVAGPCARMTREFVKRSNFWSLLTILAKNNKNNQQGKIFQDDENELFLAFCTLFTHEFLCLPLRWFGRSCQFSSFNGSRNPCTTFGCHWITPFRTRYGIDGFVWCISKTRRYGCQEILRSWITFCLFLIIFLFNVKHFS